MGKDRQSPAGSSGQRRRSAAGAAAKKAAKSGRQPSKRPTNLTLDPEAIARGEHFGKRHGTSLSQLVNRFLHALPGRETGASTPELSPAVRRLYGVAAGARTDRKAYRSHLLAKYGSEK